MATYRFNFTVTDDKTLSVPLEVISGVLPVKSGAGVAAFLRLFKDLLLDHDPLPKDKPLPKARPPKGMVRVAKKTGRHRRA